MAIQALVQVTYAFVPDGANQMTAPSSQSLKVTLTPSGPSASPTTLSMPGGNTVTLANLTTLNTQIATALTAYLTANPAAVSQITAFPTGGL